MKRLRGEVHAHAPNALQRETEPLEQTLATARPHRDGCRGLVGSNVDWFRLQLLSRPPSQCSDLAASEVVNR